MALANCLGCSFFQVIISYVGIFFDEREYSILNPMRPVVMLLLVLIGPGLFIHDAVIPKIRLWYSYARKMSRRVRGLKELDIPPSTQFELQLQKFRVSYPVECLTRW